MPAERVGRCEALTSSGTPCSQPKGHAGDHYSIPDETEQPATCEWCGRTREKPNTVYHPSDGTFGPCGHSFHTPAPADPGEQERCCPGCGAQAGEGQRRTATGEWCQHDWHNRPPQQAGEQRPERFGDWRDTVKQPNPDGTWTVECPTCHQDWTVPSGGQGVLFELYNLDRALGIAHDTIAELLKRHPEEEGYISGRATVEHDSWDGALN